MTCRARLVIVKFWPGRVVGRGGPLGSERAPLALAPDSATHDPSGKLSRRVLDEANNHKIEAEPSISHRLRYLFFICSSQPGRVNSEPRLTRARRAPDVFIWPKSRRSHEPFAAMSRLSRAR